MVKLVLLFGASLILVAAGGYARNNPETVKRWGQTLTPVQPAVKTTEVNWSSFSPPNKNYQFYYPNNWRLEEAVPGCGPVWFAPETNKIWVTICGPYSGESSQTLANQASNPEQEISQKVEINIDGQIGGKWEWTGETGKGVQVFLDNGLAIYFFDLSGEDNETKSVFEKMIAEMKFAKV